MNYSSIELIYTILLKRKMYVSILCSIFRGPKIDCNGNLNVRYNIIRTFVALTLID